MLHIIHMAVICCWDRVIDCLIIYRITTDSGHQHLVHKGPQFGKASDTVVTDARHMSDRWKVSLNLVAISPYTVKVATD